MMRTSIFDLENGGQLIHEVDFNTRVNMVIAELSKRIGELSSISVGLQADKLLLNIILL